MAHNEYHYQFKALASLSLNNTFINYHLQTTPDTFHRFWFSICSDLSSICWIDDRCETPYCHTSTNYQIIKISNSLQQWGIFPLINLLSCHYVPKAGIAFPSLPHTKMQFKWKIGHISVFTMLAKTTLNLKPNKNNSFILQINKIEYGFKSWTNSLTNQPTTLNIII